MATKREKNSGKQQKRELWKNILWGFFVIGLQVFVLLSYFTRIPVNKPIDSTDTETVTVVVQDIEYKKGYYWFKRHGPHSYYYLNVHTESEVFKIYGKDYRDEYSVSQLNDAIKKGDTLTLTYLEYYPWLFPKKFVVDIRSGNQVYRSLDAFNENIKGELLWQSILLFVLESILLPITLFTLDVPQKIWQKAKEKRRRKKKEAEKAAKRQKTAPD